MPDPGPQPGMSSGLGSIGPVTPVTGAPGMAREALGMVMAGLSWLADADLASASASVQADCLRELERAALATLPLDADVQFLTITATKMPFIGRG